MTEGRFAVFFARARFPVLLVGVLIALTFPWHSFGFVGAALIVSSIVSGSLPYKPLRRQPVEVFSPVEGRWIAVNSPADKVPSHGLHAYGQAYAIDLVYWPEEKGEWKAVHSDAVARRPETFPAFGRAVLAPADGTVVRARDVWRDHGSRNSWPAFAYMIFEGALRELAGPGGVLGNHVVLDLGGGVYAAFAHLRRGSVRVRKGERVTAGQQLGEVGNSGNSSEPHLHFQLMDLPRAGFAAGLPFTFVGHGVPGKANPLDVPETAGPRGGARPSSG